MSMEGVQGGVAQPGCRQEGVQGGGLHVDVGGLHTCVCAVGSAKVHEAVLHVGVGLCTSAVECARGCLHFWCALLHTKNTTLARVDVCKGGLHTCARALGCV